jgi:hypothetical protein
MKFFMSFFELWVRHMRVDLSRRDRGMAKKFLDYTYISTICQKSCCKRVTKRMCMHIFEYSCSESIILYHIGDKKSSESDRFI